MSTIGPNQFSVKIKVPQGILYNRPERLADVFRDTLEGYLGKGRFQVQTRFYMNALKCRITVIFKERPSHPDSIRALVEKIGRRTVETVIIEKTNRNNLC